MSEVEENGGACLICLENVKSNQANIMNYREKSSECNCMYPIHKECYSSMVSHSNCCPNCRKMICRVHMLTPELTPRPIRINNSNVRLNNNYMYYHEVNIDHGHRIIPTTYRYEYIPLNNCIRRSRRIVPTENIMNDEVIHNRGKYLTNLRVNCRNMTSMNAPTIVYNMRVSRVYETPNGEYKYVLVRVGYDKIWRLNRRGELRSMVMRVIVRPDMTWRDMMRNLNNIISEYSLNTMDAYVQYMRDKRYMVRNLLCTSCVLSCLCCMVVL